MHVFQAEATVAFITKMHKVTTFLCVYLVWKQLSFNNPGISIYLWFSVNG